jgi:dihydrofolate reductase
MRKLIAAINITLDGFCDHTAGIADDGLHEHFTDVLRSAGVILYGRITYQLMESYWPSVVKNPTGNKTTDDFAQAIQDVPKILFSRTVKNVEWENTKLARKSPEEEALELKKQPGKDIFVGSPSLIAQFTHLDLIDEYQLTVHPVILGKGLPLFKNINERIVLSLVKSKAIGSSGAMTHYYRPTKK